ncbi:MAG TPA: HupE/UreJ family protein [Steroidobacteraceae bacterium]|jgi:hypothetical protein|nr:HupE/UreJ family protein [Steroidobacteraceae bacterium]
MRIATLARCAALGLVLFTGVTDAHTKSTSYSEWNVEGASVRLVYTVPLVESARLKRADETQPADARLALYLAAHLSVTAGTQPCSPSPPRVLQASAQFRRVEIDYRCAGSAHIVLHSSAFFDLVPSHVSLAQIRLSDGRVIQQIFTRDSQTLATSGDANSARDAGILRYIQMGIVHIFTGTDHMAFLLGLVLISRRPRDLIFVVTGFTMGHSITLALAVTGIIRPHAQYIDALVALTIAMIGAENIAVATHRPGVLAAWLGSSLLLMAAASALGTGTMPALVLLGAGLFAANYLMLAGHLPDAARLRIVVTVVFGLIHGFGFAANLLEQRLPSAQLLHILFGFNLGVEIGQLTLVLGVLALVALLVRLKLALPRPIVVETVSAGLVGLGTYWFISRAFAPPS